MNIEQSREVMDIRIEKVEKDWFVGSFQRTIDEQHVRILELEAEVAEVKGHLKWALDECPKKNTFGWTKERQDKYDDARRACEK